MFKEHNNKIHPLKESKMESVSGLEAVQFFSLELYLFLKTGPCLYYLHDPTGHIFMVLH